jgi:ATP-binding protein involved in chromosome partitioning
MSSTGLQPSPLPSPAKFVIAIGSGKGGVGKSTVSLNVALALNDEGTRVGLLDADVFGPNIPRMLGLARARSVSSWELARNSKLGPVRINPLERYGLQVMSSGLIMGEDHPLTLSSAFIDMIVRQFFIDVAWSDLDYLIVDLPPGTAELHQTLTERFPLDCAVVVVTPEDVAHLDGRRAIAMFRRAGVSVLGGVENMAGMSCPHCLANIDLLPRAADERTIWAREVPRLGSVPFDPAVAAGGESGTPIMISAPESASASGFRRLAERIMQGAA